MDEKPLPLYSAIDARATGFREGRAARLAGGQPAELEQVREAQYEDHPEHRHTRGPHTLHYRSWRAGFDAGFLAVAEHVALKKSAGSQRR